MIKNEKQLSTTEKRLKEISELIDKYQSEYTGIQRDIHVIPLIDEEKQIKAEIDEFKLLRSMKFIDSVIGPLSEPVLIDHISDLLTKLRIAAKLTQDEFAEMLGWEQSNLSRFENENYSSQTIAKIIEYASALGVWLHVTPSLTEKVPEIKYRKELSPIPKSDFITTSGQFAIDENQFETDSHIQYRKKREEPGTIALCPDQEFITA